MAKIGIPGKVRPLEKSDLESSTEDGNTDGEIIIRKIEAFLKNKNLPEKKQNLTLIVIQTKQILVFSIGLL